MNNEIYTWDKESGITTYTICDKKGRKFVGVAKCHPDDADFGNEFTGIHIASNRAAVLYLKSVIKNELQPGLDALKQLYYSINQSSQFNPKSYEAKMLYRQIVMKQTDIETIKEDIVSMEQNIKTYINEKDNFYKTTRSRRQKANLD